MKGIARALCGGGILLLIGCGKTHAAQEAQDGTRAIPRDTANAAAIDSAIVTPAEITLGDSVFNGQPRGGMCATCHGPRGVGTAAAPRLDDQQWIHGDGSLGFIEGTIVQGVPHPAQHPFPMPPFGGTLTDRQLHAVAAYVYSLSHPPKGTPP
jgi:mono/diheme cytochrome c family protein